MPRICIIDTTTNVCINVIEDDNGEFFNHHIWAKAPRNDGQVGWTLLENGEWFDPTPMPTYDDKVALAKAKREKYFSLTDKLMIPDFPITEEVRTQWVSYRQQLRDITLQEGFPDNIVWPTPPSDIYNL